jgi:hypothetical protein
VKFLFYPHLPSEKNALIYKICTIKGWEMVNDPYAPFDLAINWEDITYRNQDETLLSLKQKTFVINGECIDISKQYIDAVHHKVFGYGLGVDPTVFEGEVAQKSDSITEGLSNVLFQQKSEMLRLLRGIFLLA